MSAEMMMTPTVVHVLDYAAALAAGPTVVGGKAFAIARLDAFGFHVPPGFAVGADAFRAHLAREPIAPLVRALAARDAAWTSTPEAERELARVREAVESADLDVDLRVALGRALDDHGLADVAVAVRSSATAEDGAKASFAGIHESHLDVKGLDGVARALRACWASLFTPRALAYRRAVGLEDEEVAGAVLVCRMVAARCAGVAFGCDPRTGARDVVVIEAVQGLAEGLVRGATAPGESWRVDLRADRPRAVAVGSGPSPLLGDERALELARVVDRIGWAFGEGQEPQDVEWAHDGERLWIVQARPVTRLPRPRFAGSPPKLPAIWSNANVKDAIPGVLTPLGWSGVKRILDAILHDTVRASGFAVPEGLEGSRRIQGRVYLDLAALEWGYWDAFGVEPEHLDRSLGGHHPTVPVDPVVGFRRRLARLARGMRLGRAVDAAARRLPDEIARLRGVARERLALDLTRLDRPALHALSRAISDEARAFGHLFMLAGSDTSGLLLEKLLARWLGAEARAVAAGLLAGSNAVVSAEHGLRLADLAAALAKDPEARALDGSSPDAWRRLPEASPFRRELEAFLEEFGHRCVYEGEIANPRWREDPRFLIEQAVLLLEAGACSQALRGAALERRAKAEARLAALPWWARRLARNLAEKTRAAGARREAAKSALGMTGEPSRKVVLEIGRRLVASGHLEARDDVFFLTAADLDAWTSGAWDGRGARALVRERRARRDAWLREEAKDVHLLDDAGQALDPKALATLVAPAATRATSSGSKLIGIAASPGTASGVARVVRHPEEGARLRAGEILVAPSTDPGWTPLFLRARALVVETGGYLSHGSIVARELGLPAVVNVPGVLAKVRDGASIAVDGDRGEVALA